MAKIMHLDWKLSRRQNDADEAPEQFVMYGGAKGGGKSFWLCRWAFQKLFKFPGNKGFLGRKRSVDFTNTTLETFKKAIPGELYKINEQKKKIYVPHASGSIDFGGMDDQDSINKFNSAEYGFIGIDQAEEMSRDDFSMLRGTLRHKLKNGKEPDYHVRLTANPAQCWLKDDFISSPRDGFRFIKALPSDNPFLAKDYIENLKEAFKHRPELLQAYLYGSWDDLSGHDLILQYSEVVKAKSIEPRGRIKKRIIVCDPAHFGDDSTVIYVMEQSSAVRVVDKEILKHRTLMDTAGRLHAKAKEFGATLIAVDGIGIGTGIIDRLHELDAPVMSVVSSQRPSSEVMATKYTNLRTQIWFQGAEKVMDGKVKVPDDDTLCGDLSCLKYEFASNGRMKAEAKANVKRRLDRSPDEGDAFMMGLYAIDYAEDLEEAERERRICDRQGHGIPVGQQEYDYCTGEQYEVAS